MPSTRAAGRGTSAASRPSPGIYFLGLPWQSRRGSSFIWGVWHDAKFIADHIATQRDYLAYRGPDAPHDRRPPDHGDPDGPHPHPQVQHQGHLSRAEARQRSLPGGRRARHDDLSARPVPAGSRHREEHRQPRSGRADPQGDAEHPPADRGVRRHDGAPLSRSSSTSPTCAIARRSTARWASISAACIRSRPGSSSRPWRGRSGWSRSTPPPSSRTDGNGHGAHRPFPRDRSR